MYIYKHKSFMFNYIIGHEYFMLYVFIYLNFFNMPYIIDHIIKI